MRFVARALVLVAILAGLSLTNLGCIMVLGVRAPVTEHSGHKRVIEVDGEFYIVDVEENTVRKIDSLDRTESTTTIGVITTDD